MSLLAYAAIDKLATTNTIDRVLEKIPGGFFTPEERKKARKKASAVRHKSEDRYYERGRRRSHRDHSPPSDSTDESTYDDTDHENEYRNKKNKKNRYSSRAKSLGRSISRSLSRGRHRDRERSSGSGLDGEMDRSDNQPRFPPPPSAEYRPYNPADYASPPPGATGAGAYSSNYYDDRRTASARPDYGYPSQVNTAFRSPSATLASPPPLLSPDSIPLPPGHRPSASPFSPNLSAFNSPPPFSTPPARGSPLHVSFAPSHDPPLATLLHRPATNTLQPQGGQPVSSTAQRYTPGAGYSPSPTHGSFPPPNPGYGSYNPADFASPNQARIAPGNTYPSPPPFYRQQSRSQPSLPQYPPPDNTLTYYDAPSRHDSSASHLRHGDDKHHSQRTRSAGQNGRSRSRVTDRIRDRFEGMDLHDKGLAASVGGALAGGFAGNAVGHGTLSTLAGAAIGAFGGRELEKRYEKKKTASRSTGGDSRRGEKSRSRSRRRSSRSRARDYSTSPSPDRRDRYDRGYNDKFSDSDSDGHHRAARKRRSSRRRRDDDER
ncbi:hypothetical protein P154DRAFT_530904 [Amniculicola lignicola CBS 123094]|uniref:Glycine zipper 2TM domain-containing protein n=1 Tax=Amniculicola lignicola CBS 123094 TaxID=1392246 RepID=A0A6A5WTU1_9PLEO|nr:hypothetical protein P154DRAFT_530904 [Amniculicola lignicola CBS 123094]